MTLPGTTRREPSPVPGRATICRLCRNREALPYHGTLETCRIGSFYVITEADEPLRDDFCEHFIVLTEKP